VGIAGHRPLHEPASMMPPRPFPHADRPTAVRELPTAPPPLAGFTVAVATDLRRHELAQWLDAEGARTIGFRAVRVMPQPDPDAIAAAVRECVAEPVHEVIVSSAFGLRAWLDAARRAGHVDELVRGFTQTRLLARDARTADGLRELGLTQIWSTAAGTTEDLFRYLIAQPMVGRRVVAQIETDAQLELCLYLRSQGASVVEVATTQARPPSHTDVLRRLCDLIARRQVDAVALAGPAATRHLLDQATRDGVADEVLNAFVEDVAAICLGPLTATPLRALGVPVVQAREPVSESLAAQVVAELPRRSMVVEIAGHRIEVRGQAVVIADHLVPVQAGPLGVLRALAGRPGRVMSAAEIRAAMPRSSTVDDHAIEMAVSRLRSSIGHDLGGAELVQTVMKRGYRLAV
jgi:uroporphyrinogen-III synthase